MILTLEIANHLVCFLFIKQLFLRLLFVFAHMRFVRKLGDLNRLVLRGGIQLIIRYKQHFQVFNSHRIAFSDVDDDARFVGRLQGDFSSFLFRLDYQIRHMNFQIFLVQVTSDFDVN